MAARLEWKNRDRFGGELMLGTWLLASVFGVRKGGKREFRYEVEDRTDRRAGPYERIDDAIQDAECEVRRRLKEAGVSLAD